MSRYTGVTSTPASPRQSSSGRASLHSSRRPSISSFRFARRQESRVPDPDEMDAAFDAPPDADDDENENENSGLLGRENREAERNGRIPGEYNFDHAHVRHVFMHSIYLQQLLMGRLNLLNPHLLSKITLLIILHLVIRMVSLRLISFDRPPNLVISSVASCHPLSCHVNLLPVPMGG